MTDGQERVYCPVCQAKFRFIDGWREGDTVMCPICGQRLTLRSEGGAWTGDRVDAMTEKEIRDRAENFAKLRGYTFTDIKEEIIEGLVGKQKRFGDFYCPCRMLHTPEYQCPCKPTRGGDVERDGRCHCGFFWKWPCCRTPVIEISHSEPVEQRRTIDAWSVHRFCPVSHRIDPTPPCQGADHVAESSVRTVRSVARTAWPVNLSWPSAL